jgi:adenylate cyclase
MQAFASSEVFLFEDFRLDRCGGGLFRRDESGVFAPVAVGSRGLDILGVLIARAGEVISKDEIIAAVWPGTVVEDSNLTVQISALRRVLDRGRPNGGCIQTVPGRGYRFVAAVTHAAAEPPSIASPMRPDAVADVPELSTLAIVSRRHRVSAIGIAASVGAVALLGVGAWWLESDPKLSTAPEIVAAASVPQPLVAPRLSIVVLPFANLSNNPERQYFADGITEDVTTDLSRIPNMFVIARSTAFSYRGKLADSKQIGRELGVRYLLEGSVQTLGTRLRITAQLIDGETNAHLWAERFDRDAADLYTLQNEITGRIAAALHLELLAAETARPTADPDALDYILRGMAALRKPATRDGYAETIGLFEHALALDPRSAEAQSRLADVLSARVMAGWAASVGADIARAEGLAGQALAATPRNPQAHFARAQVLRAQRRYAEATPEYETALALNRNIVAGWHALAQCKLFTGSIEETIPLEEQAIRLSPRDPYLHLFYSEIGFVHLLQSRTDEAILWLEKARNANPEHPGPHIRLAAAYGLEGEPERSAAELAEARRLAVAGTFSSIAKMKAGIPSSVPPTSRALFDTTYFAGLRKAGMPEE